MDGSVSLLAGSAHGVAGEHVAIEGDDAEAIGAAGAREEHPFGDPPLSSPGPEVATTTIGCDRTEGSSYADRIPARSGARRPSAEIDLQTDQLLGALHERTLP